jgi:hypothetical protein
MNVVSQIIKNRLQRNGKRKVLVRYVDADDNNAEVGQFYLFVEGDITKTDLDAVVEAKRLKTITQEEDKEFAYREQKLEERGINVSGRPRFVPAPKMRRHLVKRIFNNAAEGEIEPALIPRIWRARQFINNLTPTEVSQIMGWRLPEATNALSRINGLLTAIRQLDHGLGLVPEEANRPRNQRIDYKEKRSGNA